MWVLLQVSFLSSAITSVVYWCFIARYDTKQEIVTAFNIHKHVILLLLITLDAFIVAIPIRLLHVIYGMGFSMVYCFFLLVLHWTGVNSTVYQGFSWKDSPLKMIGFSISMIFIANPLVHCLLYLIHRIRVCIFRTKITRSSM